MCNTFYFHWNILHLDHLIRQVFHLFWSTGPFLKDRSMFFHQKSRFVSITICHNAQDWLWDICESRKKRTTFDILIDSQSYTRKNLFSRLRFLDERMLRWQRRPSYWIVEQMRITPKKALPGLHGVKVSPRRSSSESTCVLRFTI